MPKPPGDDRFLTRLRATFQVEADEHLQHIGAGLLKLEQGLTPQDQASVIDSVFRAAHSLKGAARAVEYRDIETLCEILEDRFADWRRGARITTDTVDALQAQLDAIGRRLAGAEGGDSGAASSVPRPRLGRASPTGAQSSAAPEAPKASEAPETPAAAAVVDRSSGVRPEPSPSAGPASSSESSRAAGPGAGRQHAAVAETIRVSRSQLDAGLLEVEEMLALKLVARQRVEELSGLATQRELSAPTSGRALASRMAAALQAAERDREQTERQVDALLDRFKTLLLLPFATIAAGLPRLVRDLCRDQGKEAELRIEGEQIEIDKRILEEIKDPLIHLVRNAVDHGIEPPAVRQASGKPPHASLVLQVTQVAGGRIQIMLSDDGAGIDSVQLREAALRRGIVSADEIERFNESQLQALVFAPDVSTRRHVSALSGRGLGLAIVREKAEKLGGKATVESRPGHGTSFRIVVPATRVGFRGILVQAQGQPLVIPTRQVDHVLQAQPDQIRYVEGRPAVALEDGLLPLVWLADVLELTPGRPRYRAPAALKLLQLGQDQPLALAVDDICDEQEILLKPLHPPLSRVRNVAAATILPDGKVALVLNVTDLLQSARVWQREAAASRFPPPAVPAGKSILVAEDSITSRMLLKSVLDAAGYTVVTAVDGIDAYERLKAGHFDVLVSDVEMPRLDGLALTQKIRADRNLAHLRVVLVTTLDRPQDRARGSEVGADAFIVKGSFEQTSLLEAVARLV